MSEVRREKVKEAMSTRIHLSNQVLKISFQLNVHLSMTFRTSILHSQGEISEEILPCSGEIKQIQSRKIPL